MGSTVIQLHTLAPGQDHPHIHGEHPDSVLIWRSNLGSPPYTWGALQNTRGRLNGGRITPIYMGSTSDLAPFLAALKDHPHIHGEHFRTPEGV